jgi:UDP-N-acetylglucosamine 1-carboxyvinyltransferase
MNNLQVEGKYPLKGEIRISGNKNAALPMLAATLLTDETVTLHNVPDILDVHAMLEGLRHLGAEAEYCKGTVRVKAANLRETSLSRDLCSRIRTSILFAGPLAYRTGKAEIWPPGGDVIGRRRLDGHFYGLKGLGYEIDAANAPFKFYCKKRPQGRELFLDEASVTATEQLLCAAAVSEGETIIRNAAAEPHVVNLGEMLCGMGAKITGLGSNTLTVTGAEKLCGIECSVYSDHIEAGSFLALGAASGGELLLTGTMPRHYWMLRRVFERLGIEMELRSDAIFLPGGQQMRVRPDFGNHIPVISDGPWPQYPSDMMSCTIVAATQAEGSVLFFEKMFESRIYFVDRLIAMGANAIICDPHRAIINGPSQLRGMTISSPDIRAGMALLIAALCAKGTSTIQNINVIERGYENIVEKVQSIGGKIKLV